MPHHPMQLWEGFNLPDTVVTQAIAVLARRGAGKSYLATKLAGLMARAGHQIIALDPVGVWWGLRVSADGKEPSGLQIVVFGGRHGDLPLADTDGPVIARLLALAETPISAVLDVSGFESMAAQRRFVADFASDFFMLKKMNARPVHVFLEEAQEFAPQKPRPDATRMLGAIERLVKIGRNYQIGVTMVSQRPQAVNKDVLTQAEMLVLLQIAGAHERKALAGWMDEKGEDTKALLAELPGLQRGEAMVWSPSWLKIREKVRITPKDTLDTSSSDQVPAPSVLLPGRATSVQHLIDTARRALLSEPHEPKPPRKKPARPHPPAATKPPYTSGRQAIGAAVDAAAERTRGVTMNPQTKGLEVHEIGEAWGQRRSLRARPISDAEATAILEPPGRTTSQIADELVEIARRLGGIANELGVKATIEDLAKRGNGEARTFLLNEAHELPRGTKGTKHRDAPPANLDGLGRAATRLLEQLVRWHPAQLTRPQLATQAGFSPKSGTFRNALSQLRVGGLMDDTGEKGAPTLGATSAGLGAFGAAKPAPILQHEVRDAWMQKLASAPRRLLGVLTSHYPSSASREELAVGAGLSTTSGTFRNALSRLRVNGLLDGTVKAPLFRASPHLFMEKAVVGIAAEATT